MEKGFEYWFHNQHTDLQSPYMSSLRASLDKGQQTTVPSFMNACPENGSLPMFSYPSEHQSLMKANQTLESPQGWFYCMPRFRQAFAPVQSSVPKEKPMENYREAAISTEFQKRFVVFDQSGDQTTLLFSSGIEYPVQCQRLPSWSPKPYSAFDFKRDEPVLKGENGHYCEPLMVGENDRGNETDEVESEMHEDTEELNALLYSDDEVDDSEDDEETSTGHSPSAMTGFDGPDRMEENGEEVASYDGPSKRRKLVHSYYGVPSLMDSASSVKTSKQCLDYEDDAQSSYCGDGKNKVLEELSSDFLFGNKQTRKEKIRKTISVLQQLIPSGDKSQDAVMVLDEAIQYLTFLKVKIKAFGLDSL